MLSEQFQVLLKTIKTGDLSEFEDFIEDFKVMKFLDLPDSLEFEKIKDDREKRYYLTLSKLLSSLRFNEFSQLINYSDEMGIFIEAKKIPFRLKIIARLHLDGMGRGIIGRIFEIIRFFNDYNLFEMDLTKNQLEIIEDIKRNDKPLIANLRDLFGKVSNSLIYYSCKIMPYDLLLSNEERARRYLADLEQIRLTLSNEDQLLLRRGYSLNYLKRFTDWYSMYGLSVRNLGSVEEFIDIFEEYYEERIIELRNDQKFLDFNLRYGNYYIGVEDDRVYRETKKHFMSPENILKNKEDILNRDNYNFYSISMVLFGGLGPEGLGFTYSTPRGEIVEICSDQKETEAIIIKFKQYLKEKFLDKLEEEMVSLNINANIRKKITKILEDVLKPKDLISYYNKDSILRKIKKYLYQIDEFQQAYKSELEEIIKKISIAVSIILRRIKLKDQFMTRMELVTQGKIKSEDIAKLTSLRGKSHYDVLCERFYFQNEINWFFKDYPDEIEALEKKFSRLLRKND